MQTIMLDDEVSGALATAAEQLHISQQAMIKLAVDDYMEKIKKHQNLLSFAGILDETEAEEMLNSIQRSKFDLKV